MSRLVPQSWRKHKPAETRSVWDPFSNLHSEIDRLFEDFHLHQPKFLAKNENGFHAPSIDVSETDDALTVEADLPGLDEENIDLILANNVLTLKGEKKSESDEKKKDYHVVERSSGSFMRSIALPFEANPESVDASFSKGVLKITIPKPAEVKDEARRIKIARGEG